MTWSIVDLMARIASKDSKGFVILFLGIILCIFATQFFGGVQFGVNSYSGVIINELIAAGKFIFILLVPSLAYFLTQKYSNIPKIKVILLSILLGFIVMAPGFFTRMIKWDELNKIANGSPVITYTRATARFPDSLPSMTIHLDASKLTDQQVKEINNTVSSRGKNFNFFYNYPYQRTAPISFYPGICDNIFLLTNESCRN